MGAGRCCSRGSGGRCQGARAAREPAPVRSHVRSTRPRPACPCFPVDHGRFRRQRDASASSARHIRPYPGSCLPTPEPERRGPRRVPCGAREPSAAAPWATQSLAPTGVARGPPGCGDMQRQLSQQRQSPGRPCWRHASGRKPPESGDVPGGKVRDGARALPGRLLPENTVSAGLSCAARLLFCCSSKKCCQSRPYAICTPRKESLTQRAAGPGHI